MKRILICAGGTGGHIYPAITLAQRLQELNHQVSFIGARNRMEATVIPEKKFSFIGLSLRKFQSPVGLLVYLYDTIVAFFRCLFLVGQYDVVVGFGNYISVPVILAAFFRRKHIVLHEQNSIPGKANLFLAKFARVVCCSFQDSMRYFKSTNTFFSGNPQSALVHLEKDEEYIKQFRLDSTKKTVLFFFGSLGSHTLDIQMQELMKDFKQDYQIIYATGKNYFQQYSGFSHENIRIVEKVDGLKALLCCDLLVSRSGATTLSEIASLRVASILIPSPYVSNNHQYFNAKLFYDADAAELLEENTLNAFNLNQSILKILNNDVKLKELGENASKFSKPDALNLMVEKVLLK